jgi:hypothetical protein
MKKRLRKKLFGTKNLKFRVYFNGKRVSKKKYKVFGSELIMFRESIPKEKTLIEIKYNVEEDYVLSEL